MDVKSVIKNLRIGFGFAYFLINTAVLTVFGIAAIYTAIISRYEPGWIMLLFPLMGIMAGYWIRHGRFGWWRVSIIVFSLIVSVAALYIGFF